MHTVCREEIANCVEGAFARVPCTPDDLITYATEHGARPPVVATLARLHQPEYRSLRDLWGELADVPIGP